LTFILGSWATLACNIPDFSRYAKSSKGQYIQLPFLPAIFTACAIIGIVTTSASYVLYGQYLWNPLDILQHWLDDYGTSGARAAVFFAALSWYIAQVSTTSVLNMWHLY
jgi:nucleobase:cation symporter-1, NCS1 family